MNKVTAIIPCAGFGKRMNMEVDKSKEMLVNPVTERPLIDYHLNLCKKHNLSPLIISRKEKLDLNNYILNQNIPLITMDTVDGEWAETVYKSHEYWSNNNLLLLPDTQFEPTNIIEKLKQDLVLGMDLSIALHKVEDASKWCVLRNKVLLEKSSNLRDIEGWAFGVIAFKKDAGEKLFKSLWGFHSYSVENTSLGYLNSFKDLTRTGVVG